MNQIPLVSVITIFLNAEKYIEEAIKSVLMQSYEHWELLLVDDGSSDASSAIARHYSVLYPDKIRYLDHQDHKNRGMSASRNLGIKQAQGEYIAFLDADDVWLPHKLELQVAILNSQPEAAMVYGRTFIWHSWTGRTEDQDRDCLLPLGVTSDSLNLPPRIFTLFISRKASSPGTCNVLIRREAIEAVGGFEEVFHSLYEDQVFFAKICLKFPVFVTNDCSAYYRQHPTSCSRLARQKGQYYPPNSAHLIFINWLVSYLQDQGIYIDPVWKVVQKELWPYRHPRLYQGKETLKWLMVALFSRIVSPFIEKDRLSYQAGKGFLQYDKK